MFRPEGVSPRWVLATNVGSVEIPPFSVVEVYAPDATNTTDIYTPWGGKGVRVRRPATAAIANLAVNGATTIPPLGDGLTHGIGKGLVAVSGPVFINPGYTITAGTNAPGTLLACQANSFVLTAGSPGFVVLGERADSTNGLWLVDFVRASQMKYLCRFTLGGTLSGASVSATISDQYGPGTAHSSTSITVYNLLDSAAGYVFSGASGAAGLAMWDSGTSWRIIQMECP